MSCATTRRNLESNAVNKYIEHHSNTKHIPVDSENVPTDSFFKDWEYLCKCIEGLADVNGFNFRNFCDKNRLYISMYGFGYANSNSGITIQNKINQLIEKGLQKINDEKLFQIHQEWIRVNERRENVMIQNIYNYGKQHSFDKAIFMIGLAHRNSIIQKIAKYENISEFKLNWRFTLFDDLQMK